METRTQYYILFCFAQVCGIVSVILLGTFFGTNFSLNWSNSSKTFVHGFVMFLGLVYLQGTSISLFRVLNSIEKKYVKIGHIALHTVTFAMNIIGLVAIFDRGIDFSSSLHAWIGLITVILFSLQGVLGFLGYFYPKASEDIRKTMMPYHRNFGLAIFSMALINSLIGLNLFSVVDPPQVVWTGLLAILYGIFIFISVKASQFRRDNIYD